MSKLGCPACGITNLKSITVDHLTREYLTMRRAEFDRVFGQNAKRARKEIAEILIGLGVTEIPNIFGPIQIQD